MTTTDQAWKDNSGGDLRQYDFSPPDNWSPERVAREQAAILDRLAALDAAAGPAEEGWLDLARALPQALRAALVLELRAGNQLRAIGSTHWPQQGSIVVNVQDRFRAAQDLLPSELRWRRLDDPHYCREELSQLLDTVEHLIIT